MRNHVIARNIANQQYYWNTCGWVTEERGARRYSESEANLVLIRMRRSGLDARIRRWQR
jgi:hypothetical protein